MSGETAVPAPEHDAPAPRAIDALTHRLDVTPVWARRVVLGLILAITGAGTALLSSSALSGQKIPDLTQADVNRVFHTPSASGFKAERDVEVVDDVSTQAQRDEARASVRPVFDYDPQVQSGVLKSVQGAFGEMQEEVARFEAERAGKKPPEDAAAQKKKAVLEGKAPAADELTERLLSARPRFEALVPVSDVEDYEALVADRFSRDAEQAVSALLEVAYRARLVGSREELSRIDARGITVRILGGTSEHELATAQPQVQDLREAQGELDRWASVPGNLLPDAPQGLRRAVLRLAKRQLRANLTVNKAETEVRRRHAYEAAKPAVLSLKRGQRVIGDGELITQTHLLLLKAMRDQSHELDLAQVRLGSAVFAMVLAAAAWVFARSAFRSFRPGRKDAAFMALLGLGLLTALKLWMSVADAVHDRYEQLPAEALLLGFPIAAGAMLVRFLVSGEVALFFAVVFACLVGLVLGGSLSVVVFALVTSLVAAERVGRAKDRAGIFRAGAWTAVAAVVVTIASGMAEGRAAADVAWTAVFAALGVGFGAPMVVMALTPLTEALFGYASDIKLLELANLNHPALKELVLQAPGTYHHSIIMGSLVEAAAESIGANPLLARSCAYYHDIGKGKNPAYFGENQKGHNAHDELAPVMSAVIIRRHVTDGLEMARQYKLPGRVADAIPQHHGTRLVGYFFHKAQKEQEGKEHPAPVDENLYRYPGPKPQFREAALVMIADAVEAASRSMPEPTRPKLSALVQTMINMIFSEGQLDECDLTLKDLHLIAESFVRTLEGIYHARPVYPPGAVGGGKPPSSEVMKGLSLASSDGPRR